MAAETQYTGNTGMVTISTANSNRDGTGTMGTVLTAASSGTLVKTVSIKAQVSNSGHNMVRLFVDNGAGTISLLKEIDMPPTTKATINRAFEARVNLNFMLKSGYILKASTALDSTINVIAEGLDWTYYTGTVREDTTQYNTNNGMISDATANSFLDGTGTLVTPYTAGLVAAGFKGSRLSTITLKTTVTSTPGMIRIFIKDTGSVKKLFMEVPVPSITPDGTDETFQYRIEFKNGFNLQAGYSILASTENAQNFNILVEGRDWYYVA